MNEKDQQERWLRRIEGFLYRINVLRHASYPSKDAQKNSLYPGIHTVRPMHFESKDLKEYARTHRN